MQTKAAHKIIDLFVYYKLLFSPYAKTKYRMTKSQQRCLMHSIDLIRGNIGNLDNATLLAYVRSVFREFRYSPYPQVFVNYDRIPVYWKYINPDASTVEGLMVEIRGDILVVRREGYQSEAGPLAKYLVAVETDNKLMISQFKKRAHRIVVNSPAGYRNILGDLYPHEFDMEALSFSYDNKTYEMFSNTKKSKFAGSLSKLAKG